MLTVGPISTATTGRTDATATITATGSDTPLHDVMLMHIAMTKCTHAVTYASAMGPYMFTVIHASHKYH